MKWITNRTRLGIRRISSLACLAILEYACIGGQVAAPGITALGAYSQPLQAPGRIAIDAAGNTFVTDPPAGQVVVFDAFGRVVNVQRGFSSPLGIAVDNAGNIYLGEEANGSVSVFDSQWQPLYSLGKGPGEFSLPNHIAIANNGVVWVSDSRAHQIKGYANGKLSLSFGTQGSNPGEFSFPTGIFASKDNELFVVDQDNDRVQVYDMAGGYRRAFSLVTPVGGMGMGAAGGRSQGITGDPSGRVFVADTFQGIVKVFDTNGVYLAKLGGFSSTTEPLRSPTGIAINRNSCLFVASANNGLVQLTGLDSYFRIAMEPSAQFIRVGLPVAFRASVGGTGPYAYQWKKDANALVDGGNVSGASSATLSLSGATLSDSGSYSLEVTGPAGTVISSGASLNVMAVPRIEAQPVAQSVATGTTVTLTALASGQSLFYQWFFNGMAIEGANAGTLTLINPNPGQSGLYSLAVSNPVGSAATDPVQVRIVDPPSPPEIVGVSMTSDGRFRLTFTADSGEYFSYTIDASPDLINWTALTVFPSQTGSIEFTDPDSGNFPTRFYRLRWVP